MIADLRSALRQLIKHPGFTGLIVLILALGIGANTAIFSAIDAVFLTRLPVKDPDSLVLLTDPDAHRFQGGYTDNGRRLMLSYAEFQHLRDHNTVFSGLMAAIGWPSEMPVYRIGLARLDHHANVSLVSGNYFQVLGLPPVMGRDFSTAVDEALHSSPVAIVSDAYWRTHLGQDQNIIGQRLHIRDNVYEIVGVAPPHFAGETIGVKIDIWIPLSHEPEILPFLDVLTPEKSPLVKRYWLQVIGRMKPGISFQQAAENAKITFHQLLQSEASAVPRDLQSQYLAQSLRPTPAAHGTSSVKGEFGQPITILMVLVGLLLLIACANVTNLLLARAAARQKEIALRIALGATPAQVFRQVVCESLLLSLLGGLAGLLFAHWAGLLLVRLVGQSIDLHINGRILAFTLGVSTVIGLIFGAFPARQTIQLDLLSALKSSSAGSTRPTRILWTRLLVVVQVAVSLLLFVIAGLFIHSLNQLANVDLGYRRDHLLQFHLNPGNARLSHSAAIQLYKKLTEQIAAMPGVRQISFSWAGLFTGVNGGADLAIDGYEPSKDQPIETYSALVGPNYFSTLGIPILLGREIGPEDSRETGPCYGVVNQTLAQHYFNGVNPIGRRVRGFCHEPELDFIIVGVVADSKQMSLRESPEPCIYLPFYHRTWGSDFVFFAVRYSGNPAPLLAAIRKAEAGDAPAELPVDLLQTFDSVIDSTLGQDHLLTQLSGFFSILAGLLACIGIYSIMSYSVARRVPEIGLRMALGAQRGMVIRLILKESLGLVLLGAAIGAVLSLAAGKLLSGLLYALPAIDVTVLAVTIALMLAVALIASYLPAWRASRIDPLVALRTD